MLRRSFSASAFPFWWPAKFGNVANPYFENIKHLQNLGHFLVTTSFMMCFIWIQECHSNEFIYNDQLLG